jgi:hypothetical protein
VESTQRAPHFILTMMLVGAPDDSSEIATGPEEPADVSGAARAQTAIVGGEKGLIGLIIGWIFATAPTVVPA